jgi:hypothetical protein
MLKIGASLRRGVHPLVFLLLLVLSFGLLIPWLGFYWDDWPIVLAARLQGVQSFWDYYRLERPFSAWSYVYSIPWLGTRPLPWHIATLVLRWLTVVGMWWCLNLLWPRQRRTVIWAVLLFAVYPIFTNQPVALTFSQQWICFSLYFLSVGLMLTAVRRPGNGIWLHTAGVAAMLVHMLTMEYIWGLELLRPIYLWLALAEKHPDWRKRLAATLRVWLPYMLVFAGVITWRFAFARELSQGNKPEALYALGVEPLQAGVSLLQAGIQDMINNLVGTWYATINPLDLDFNDRTVLASLAVAALTGVLAFYYLLRQEKGEPDENPGAANTIWLRQALVVGLLGALAGPAPVWAIDKQSLFGLHSGRFALAGMFGLSIFIVAALEWFTPRRLPKMLLLAVLIGMASGFHLRNSVTYYRSTLKQNEFYWQLYWRAPYIKPNTALLSADELFIYVGRKPTAVTLNLLYPQPPGIRQVGYWFLELYHDVGSKVVPKLARGRALISDFRTFNFAGSSLDSLVIYYKPGAGRCLWVLGPQDADNPDVPELTLQALPVSNLSRIEPQPLSDDYPPTDLFGKELPHTWCYYFQKAELARQLGDWQQIVDLGKQAQQAGYMATNQHENLVFIEGQARSGEWDQALKLTRDTFDANDETGPRLCRLWAGILQQTVASPDMADDMQEMNTLLQCTPLP